MESFSLIIAHGMSETLADEMLKIKREVDLVIMCSQYYFHDWYYDYYVGPIYVWGPRGTTTDKSREVEVPANNLPV